MNIQEIGKGALLDTPDPRDFKAEAIMSAVTLPETYTDLLPLVRIKHQDGSSSCVGQAAAQYAQVLNHLEEGKFTELSARGVYSLIYVPLGGAYLRDGVRIIAERGIPLEIDAPSYDKGKPPSESFMRNRKDITAEEIEKGLKYQAKSYAVAEKLTFDFFKQMIFQNHGLLFGAEGNNTGWSSARVRPPQVSADWGHAIFGCGWDVIDGDEVIIFANSWGDDWGKDGFGYMGRDYFETSHLFNGWTLVDKLNTEPVEPPAFKFYRTLDVGRVGEDVRALQKYLNKNGFLVNAVPGGAGSPGFETTYFGPLTKRAVAKWQVFHQVYPTYGYWGRKSIAKYNQLNNIQ